MRGSQPDLERVRLLLLAAAEDAAGWPAALTALAEACGGAYGQLIARDGQDRPLLHVITNQDPEMTDLAEANGMGDVVRNPRLQIGHRAPLMRALAEQDLVSPEARRRYPIYPDFFDRYDWSFNAQAVLHRNGEALIRTSVTRTRAQGPWSTRDLQVLSALLPYVQSAARQQLLAERRAVEGLLAAAEAGGSLMVVLNRRGWIVGASSAADQLTRSEAGLRLRGRRFRASSPQQDARLQAAIIQALEAWRGGPFPPAVTVPLATGDRGRDLMLRVVALPPKAFSLSAEPAVLILGGVGAELSPDALREAFRLSPAEIEIVQGLRRGLAPAAIADERGVSVGTVRMQLKSVFRKMGVSRQSELLARLAA